MLHAQAQTRSSGSSLLKGQATKSGEAIPRHHVNSSFSHRGRQPVICPRFSCLAWLSSSRVPVMLYKLYSQRLVSSDFALGNLAVREHPLVQELSRDLQCFRELEPCCTQITHNGPKKESGLRQIRIASQLLRSCRLFLAAVLPAAVFARRAQLPTFASQDGASYCAELSTCRSARPLGRCEPSLLARLSVVASLACQRPTAFWSSAARRGRGGWLKSSDDVCLDKPYFTFS